MTRPFPMRTYETVQLGSDRLRIGPWRGDPAVAELAPLVAGRSPDARSVARGVELLRTRGYRTIVTGALHPDEQPGYLDVGFSVLERLHLLAHDLRAVPDVEPPRLRRGRRRDRDQVLTIDHAAFSPFWRLDERGLADAIAATPSARLRVDAGRRPAGYAVAGRAGPRGYLQRLAVHPDHQGAGLGAALVIDALWWLRRRGATVVLVNTQEANERAYRLYRRLGFVPRPEGLAVLRYELDESGP